MRLFYLATALFVSITFAADSNSVIAIVNSINDYTKQLSNDVQRYNGGVPGLPYALQVQVDAVNIHKQILLGAKESKASPPFGEPGSLQVAGAILQVGETVRTTLASTTSKNQAFGDLGPIVRATLYQLKQDTNVLAAAVTEKLAPLEQQAAPIIVAQLNLFFNEAIVAYGGKAT